jgi:hypothetical protein
VNRYEQQVRWLLRAYPRAWREERGEEMLATLLDLGEGRRSVQPKVALDLLVGGWSERARRHVHAAGAAAAGWRLATGLAVVAQLVVSVVWLRDWVLTGTPVVLAHLIGNASAVTYGGALVAFIVGALAWIAGQATLARVAGVVALSCWLLTTVVFHALSNPIWTDWLELLPWSYLAILATIGLVQPPPAARRLTGMTALVAVVASQLLTSGVEPMTDRAVVTLLEQPLVVGLFDRGADTLHTALRSGWTLLAIGGLGLVRIDPRPAIAACWLLPFVALDHLAWGGPLVPGGAALAGLAVVAIAIALTRSSSIDPGGAAHT